MAHQTLMGAEVPALDRAGRQAGADRRLTGALQPGAHPAGQPRSRQPGRRRHGAQLLSERDREIGEALVPCCSRAACCCSWGLTSSAST